MVVVDSSQSPVSCMCCNELGRLENFPPRLPHATSLGDLKITSTSTERQKRSQNLSPVLVIISGSYLVFSRKSKVTSVGSLLGKSLGHRGPQNPPRDPHTEALRTPSEKQMSSESLCEGCAPQLATSAQKNSRRLW